jgi:GT2 family glycosyltransferase
LETASVKVAIVIVNYRTPELVVECLASLAPEAHADLEIVAYVGDAASGDGSVEKIRSAIRTRGYDWASCYDIGQNGGFAFGNNDIVQTCVFPDPSIDFVHFLNPDTYVRPGAVRALALFLAAQPDVGVAGSRLENPDGSLRAYAFRFPAPWREFFRGARLSLLDRAIPSGRMTIEGLSETREVDWVTGASFMVPRRILDEVGLMDDGYFLYFEETDFMARIRKAGYAVWHVAESRVVHLAGQSTGVRNGDPAVRPVPPVWLSSRARYFRRHHGRLGAACADTLYLAGDFVYRLHQILRLRRPESPPHLWRDYLCRGRRA